MLSLKLPSSTWTGTLLSALELKDVCTFPEEEAGAWSKAALLFLDCSSLICVPSLPRLAII